MAILEFELFRSRPDFSACEPGNSEALSLAMGTALSLSKVEKIKQGKLARTWIERHYAIPSIVDKWISIYQNT